MDYIQAKEYLSSIDSRGIVPGLDTIRTLLEELGNPQDKLKFIHIAGTNGKGSVGAYLSYILASSGYRVGRYLSPAVFDDCEIIQILEVVSTQRRKEEKNLERKDLEKENNKNQFHSSIIEKIAMANYITIIKKAIDRISERESFCPTRFEIETAAAFLAFLEKNCDIVVLETGMGGKEDATNIVRHVECSVFVSISRDHMAFLGDTLEEIAEEKAGIIKESVPVVSSPQKLEVKQVLQEKAKEKHTEIYFADIGQVGQVIHKLGDTIILNDNHLKEENNLLLEIAEEKHKKNGIYFLYEPYKIKGIQEKFFIPLLGAGQIENVVTALTTIEILKKKKGYHITRNDIREGLASTIWSGRFQIVRQEPLFIIDGAHNEAAAERLAESIKMYFFHDKGKKRKLIYILGIFRDKEIEKIMEKTAAMADMILTVTLDSPRGLPSCELKKKVEFFWDSIEKKGYIEDCKSVEYGLKRALELAKKEDIILAFGSLSLLHNIK